jgi:hypothetical protein
MSSYALCVTKMSIVGDLWLQIASYHAPGKYMLREGVSFAKPSPGGGRFVTFL